MRNSTKVKKRIRTAEWLVKKGYGVVSLDDVPRIAGQVQQAKEQGKPQPDQSKKVL